MATVNEQTDKLTITDETNNKNTTLDSTVYNLSSNQGTVLAQNQPIKKVTENMSSLSINKRAHKHMEDIDWTLDKMLDRNNFVEEITWNTGQAPNTLLASYFNPYDLCVSAAAATPFKTFTNARWKYLRVGIMVQCSRFQCGQIVVFYHPHMINSLAMDETQLEVYTGLKNAVLLPHILVNASQSDMVEFRIPFEYNKGWLDFTAQEVLGSLYIKVFNQLSAAVGTSTEATIHIYAALEGAEFRIPRPLPPAPKIPMRTRDDFEIIEGKSQAAMGLLNEITDAVKPFADIIDVMGEILDKKQYSTQYAPLTVKDQGYMNHQVNDEYVDRLTLTPSVMQLTDGEHYASDVSVLRTAYFLKNKWNYIQTFQYGITSTAGTILEEYAVGPFGFSFDTTTGTPTTIDYLARRFDFWRGSFRLGIQVVASPLHEGRILVAFRPSTPLGIVTTYAQNQSQYLFSCQIKGGQNEFVVDIPYLQQAPYTKMFNGLKLTPENFETYFNGTVQILASTPLKTNGTLPTTVDINVFLAGGHDFELHTPSLTNSSITTIYPTPAPPMIRGVKQSFNMEDNKSFSLEPHKMKDITLKPTSFNDLPSKSKGVMLCAKPKSEVSDPETSHFGEHYTDLQQILKRYQPGFSPSFSLNDLILTDPTKNDIINGLKPLIFPLGSSRNGLYEDSIFRQNGLFADIAACFRLQRSPMVFKIKLVTNDPNDTAYGYISYFLPNADDQRPTDEQYQTLARFFSVNSVGYQSIGGPFMPLSYISKTHVAEFYNPFLHHQATSLIYHPYDYSVSGKLAIDTFNNFDNRQLVCILYNIKPTTKYTFIVYQSFADESTFGVFQGLPQIKFSIDGDGRSLFPDYWIEP